jgi:hypothetical protein
LAGDRVIDVGRHKKLLKFVARFGAHPDGDTPHDGARFPGQPLARLQLVGINVVPDRLISASDHATPIDDGIPRDDVVGPLGLGVAAVSALDTRAQHGQPVGFRRKLCDHRGHV